MPNVNTLNLPEEDKVPKKKLFPEIPVDSLEEYFALPKNKREKWGIYLCPLALPWECFEVEGSKTGWDTFSKRIQEEYPIQGFVREYLFDYDNPVYAFFGRQLYRFKELVWTIKLFFNPPYPRFCKASPHWKYVDVSELIRSKSFAIIQDFWYEEVVEGFVNWEATPEHQVVYNWLKAAILYIEEERPKLTAEHALATSEACRSKGSYEERFGDANKLEALINSRDTEILHGLATHRDSLWT